MDATKRSTVLARADRAALCALAEELLRHAELQVLSAPRAARVMLQVTEPAEHQRFFLGELLISECEIRLGQTVSRGYAMGEDPQRALHAAIIEAAALAGAPLSERVTAFFSEQATVIASRQEGEAQLARRTQVQFATAREAR